MEYVYDWLFMGQYARQTCLFLKLFNMSMIYGYLSVDIYLSCPFVFVRHKVCLLLFCLLIWPPFMSHIMILHVRELFMGEYGRQICLM